MITVFIRRVVPLLGLAAALAVLVGLQDVPAVGSDIWLHLRLGHEFSSGWSLAHPGHLGSFDSGTWYPTQWLSQLAMARTDTVLGLGGVIWLAGIPILLFPVVLYLIGRAYAAPLPAVLTACVATAAAAPGLTARPQTLSYILIAIVTAAWLATARDGKPRYWLIPLAWIWVPLHGMWVIGITVGVAAFVGIALSRPGEWRLLARLASIPALSVAVAVLTPLGFNVFRGVIGVGDRNEQLTEWKPPDITSPSSLFLALMIVVILVSALRSEQVAWPTILILGLGMAWGAYSARTVMVGAAMLAPLLALSLQKLVPQVGRPGRREIAAVASMFLVAGVALGVVSADRADEPVVASWVDTSLGTMPDGTKILNDWELGHYVLWAHPQVDVVIHGYVDVFTTQELDRNIDILRLEPEWDQAVDELDVDYGLVDPDSPLGYALVHQLGWTEIDGDKDYVLLTPASAS